MNNTNQSSKQQPSQPSALGNIINAGVSGITSPSPAAKFVADVRAAPGAEDATAQGLQAAWNVGKEFSREFMAATIRQHGPGPAAVLQDMRIKQAISAQKSITPTGQSTTNKGIDAVRGKTTNAQSAASPSTSKSTNKGISSFQSKASGQASNVSNASSSGTAKGTSNGQSSGNGQGR
jgi:hypothetical protein